MILVTGGAGFIGSNFILQWSAEEKHHLVNLDKLTPAGNLNNLSHIERNHSYHFIKGDIRNRTLVIELLNKFKPKAIVHFASESQLERSVYHPEHFIQTNIVGTFELLEAVTSYWKHLPANEQSEFRFIHTSTGEIYGTPEPQNASFLENSQYAPHGIFAASKASADHLVRSYYLTHGLPTIISHCVKNFGPHQFPDKLIPNTILNTLQGNPLSISGDGSTMRSLIYVSDHCAALRLLLTKGIPGETYNISDESEISTIDLVKSICVILDELKPDSSYTPHATLIKFSKEKTGPEQRYPLNSAKIRSLGWHPKEAFQANLRKTVHWYLHNMSWVENVVSGEYRDWISTKYPEMASTRQ